jgi:hypothetical protein
MLASTLAASRRWLMSKTRLGKTKQRVLRAALIGDFHENLHSLGAVGASRYSIGLDTGCGFEWSLDD